LTRQEIISPPISAQGEEVLALNRISFCIDFWEFVIEKGSYATKDGCHTLLHCKRVVNFICSITESHGYVSDD
jgi:hypothetical protein